MDVFPKFIVEDGNLIVAKCTYHKELICDKDKMQGGGWWRVKDRTMTFYGESYDFGPASLEDIQKAVAEGKVYSNPSCSYSIVDRYEFQYDTQSEIIPLLKSN